jgi:hypothetical protein
LKKIISNNIVFSFQIFYTLQVMFVLFNYFWIIKINTCWWSCEPILAISFISIIAETALHKFPNLIVIFRERFIQTFCTPVNSNLMVIFRERFIQTFCTAVNSKCPPSRKVNFLKLTIDNCDFILCQNWTDVLTAVRRSIEFRCWFLTINTTFNNISVISCRWVLLVEDAGIFGEKYRLANYW